MKTPNRYKNASVATFTEDHKGFKKGDKVVIHKATAEVLKKAGKVSVKPYDYEAAVKKSREILAKQKEAQKKANA